MDFAARLANLERSAARAAAAAATTTTNTDGNRRRDRSPDASRPLQNQRPRYHHDRPPAVSSTRETLQRLGYQVHPPVWIPKVNRTRPHLCLLAITIDDLPYEHIWRSWAAAAASNTTNAVVSLVCHAKYPARVQSTWLKQRLLVVPPSRNDVADAPTVRYHSRVPAWGSIDITRAMLDCLHDAMQIGTSTTAPDLDARYLPSRFVIHSSTDVPTVDKFLFISESCLPVTTLDECVQALFPEPSLFTPPDSFAAASTLDAATNGTVAEVAAVVEDHTDAAPEAENGTATADATPEAENGTATAVAVSHAAVHPQRAAESTSATAVDPWDVSWVNARSLQTPGTPCNKYELDQFQNIHPMVPHDCRHKADQWMVLSRRHAAALSHLDSTHHKLFWTAFSRINASDEMYFATALSVLGFLELSHDANTGTVEQRPSTYTDWTEGMKNPATYMNGPRDLTRIATVAREKKCLLARKFALHSPLNETPTGQITVEEWHSIVSNQSPM